MSEENKVSLDRNTHVDSGGDTWVEVHMHDDGVLAMINRVLFHPRGFALGWTEATGHFHLTGDASEPWRFELDDEETRKLHFAFMKLMADTGVLNGSHMVVMYDPSNPPEFLAGVTDEQA